MNHPEPTITTRDILPGQWDSMSKREKAMVLHKDFADSLCDFDGPEGYTQLSFSGRKHRFEMLVEVLWFYIQKHPELKLSIGQKVRITKGAILGGNKGRILGRFEYDELREPRYLVEVETSDGVTHEVYFESELSGDFTEGG